MVAQPDPSPAAAPSATTMASKRGASEGALPARSASVKSTRISDEAVEMHSPLGPPVGEFAALAATPAQSLAPATVPAEVEPAAAVPKRTRAGARSVPPTLTVQVDSPSRQARHHGSSRSPHDTELRRVVEELVKGQARDRSRIDQLEKDLVSAFKDGVQYTDKAVHSLRGELSEFSARVDELMQTTFQSVSNLAELDERFKLHLSTAFAAIEKELGVVKAAIGTARPATFLQASRRIGLTHPTSR